jgi:hypothetical protein
MTAHPLRYFNPMACFNPWQSETLTRKHWSKSRKQLIRSRSKAKSFWNPESLSASYRKPKSGLDRQGRLRRRRSLSHASHFASNRSRRPEKLDSRFLARSTFASVGSLCTELCPPAFCPAPFRLPPLVLFAIWKICIFSY